MDTQLVEIQEKNIILEFAIDNNLYAVISKDEELEEDSEIYFGKIEYLEDIKIIRNIESDEEFEKVFAEYTRLCDSYEEGEIDE